MSRSFKVGPISIGVEQRPLRRLVGPQVDVALQVRRIYVSMYLVPFKHFR
jgi:hypothetical protein